MARDKKYGRVNMEFGDVDATEPVVVFRGRDKLLPVLLRIYGLLCKLAGSPGDHLRLISERCAEIEQWQEQNGTQVPASAGYFERMKETAYSHIGGWDHWHGKHRHYHMGGNLEHEHHEGDNSPQEKSVVLRLAEPAGRVLLQQSGFAPDEGDQVVGMLDSPELAVLVVDAVAAHRISWRSAGGWLDDADDVDGPPDQEPPDARQVQAGFDRLAWMVNLSGAGQDALDELARLATRVRTTLEARETERRQ